MSMRPMCAYEAAALLSSGGRGLGAASVRQPVGGARRRGGGALRRAPHPDSDHNPSPNPNPTPNPNPNPNPSPSPNPNPNQASPSSLRCAARATASKGSLHVPGGATLATAARVAREITGGLWELRGDLQEMREIRREFQREMREMSSREIVRERRES